MPWVVKPNRRELALWIGVERQSVDVERAAQGARELVRRGVRLAVITLDSEGAVAAWGSGSVYLPALPVEVVSTTGAGDAFVGGVAAAVARGDDLREAARLGMAASAASVTQLGAGRIDPDEVARLLPKVHMEDIP
jgi:fructose-1-phosphate kinase PfkB-like protein